MSAAVKEAPELRGDAAIDHCIATGAQLYVHNPQHGWVPGDEAVVTRAINSAPPSRWVYGAYAHDNVHTRPTVRP